MALFLARANANDADDTIEKAADIADNLALLFGAFVIFGCVAEFGLPVFGLAPDWEWSSGLVAVGVAGQVAFGRLASKLTGVVSDRLKVRLGEAEERAARLEKEAAEINRAIAGRHVTPEQRAGLEGVLSGLPVPLEVRIEYTQSDAEAYGYAGEIASIFAGLGLPYRIGHNHWLEGPQFGLHIGCPTGGKATRVKSRFFELRMNWGTVYGGGGLNAIPTFSPPLDLYIFVAPKPTLASAVEAAIAPDNDATNDKPTSAREVLDHLRKEAAPRTLADHQRATIAAEIAGKVTVAIQVQSDPGDTEAFSFAKELADALKQNGEAPEWQPWPTTFMWFNEPGVFVVPFGQVPDSQRTALVDALAAAGIHADHAEIPENMRGDPAKPSPPTLSVVVWKKPPG